MLDQNHTNNPFENKVRVRVCGLLKENEEILLLKHDQIGPAGYLWSPPGGGVSFGASVEETLKQEFLEETNLEVAVGDYLFTNEFISEKHHAIELFFTVERISGNLQLGKDPELADDEQILSEIRFFSPEELNNLPELTIHNAFLAAGARDKITDLRGLITFKH
ncbi:8-oxo-dGTP diphosphatase [Ekhidna lutea]|uniref:8-oxo-dGTP diphosphatase n=1 Tax=Ekhidna lutea TaxID=447679 RepID=A0A239L1R0_EKHLU|nr:NUDIX hydrolase [Ekhidna lutea]SNT24381.1 8-oxo-dGTP diphosphatase [Ekhidna lutea]